MRRLMSFFGVQNFEFQYIFFFLGGGVRKMTFWGGGYEDFVDIFFFFGGGGSSYNWTIFRGHHKIGLYLGVISMHLSVFS